MKKDLVHLFKKFPWSTLGRRETSQEYFHKWQEQRQRVHLLPHCPSFSICMVLDEALPLAQWKNTVAALHLQSYPELEVIIVSPTKLPKHKTFVHQLADPRFHWIDSEGQPPMELALKKATGDWLCFLRPDGVLGPCALYQIVTALEANTDLVYTNEIQLGKQGIDSHLSKPEFSWFDLVHFDYVGGAYFVKRALFKNLPDFLLQLSEKTEHWKLIPQYHFYWQKQRPLAAPDDPRLKQVAAHLKRKGFKGDASLNNNRVSLVPSVSGENKISAVICFKDKADWTIKSLRCLEKQAGKIPLEIFLVNNNSSEHELDKIRLAMVGCEHPVRIVDYPHPFNFAHMHNWVFSKHATGNVFLFLNNDVFLEGQGSLDAWAAWALREGIGTVGIKLRFPQGGIQHGGFRSVFGGFNRLARIHHAQQDKDFLSENREVFGNSFAACMVSQKTYQKIGGLSELEFPNGHGDVAFNFECLRGGLHNLYLGLIEGVHLESASRGLTYEYWEECDIERRYPDILQKMLRQDLGYGRVPDAEVSLKKLIKSGLAAKWASNASWLHPLKPFMKKYFSRMLSEA